MTDYILNTVINKHSQHNMRSYKDALVY